MQQALISGATDLQEIPESPVWSFTREKGASLTRTFRAATFKVAMDNRPPLNAFGVGPYAGMRIVDVQVKQLKGGMGELSWTMQGALLGPNGQLPELPPDEVSTEPTKEEFRLEIHPRYKGKLSDAFARSIDQALTSDDEKIRSDAYQKILSYGTDFTTGQNTALEIYEKKLLGQTHFALYMSAYKWTLFSLTTPVIDPGGYPQAPYGPVPAPIIPTLGTQAGMWLREADRVDWNGSYWKITRSWLAGINIDVNLYPVV